MRLGQVLVLCLMLRAHCDLRARDPEVEYEDEGLGARTPGESEPNPKGSGETQTPSSVPAQSGNWCTFVQKRMVTAPVMSGTEEYTVKSQSPCPSGASDCQLIMYKLSTRPVYRQTQRIITALLWQCCPGHGGHNCEDTEAQLEHMDPQQEQNDQQGAPYQTSSPHIPHNKAEHTYQYGPAHRQDHTHQHGPAHRPEHTPQSDPNHSQGHTRQSYPTHRTSSQHPSSPQDPLLQPTIIGDRADTVALRYQDTPAVLPVPQMMALVMSQLQPMLEAFNHSLVHLQSQLGALARDMAQLKGQRFTEPQASSLSRTGLKEDEQDKLDHVYQDLREVQDQLLLQRQEVDARLHSHHAMLLYNMTRIKTEMEQRFNQQEGRLQDSVQAINPTLSELKLEQDQQKESTPDLSLGPETSALWSAIERLDNKVVNNSVKVQALMEDVAVTSGRVQQLQRIYKDYDKRINATTRQSQVHFMETGLEVEAAKVVVLRQVKELTGNLSLQSQRLQELDVDVDYLYTVHYKQNNSSRDCSCSELRAVVGRLQRDVANVTALANENRLALEESDMQGVPWGESDWQPAVEALQHGLQEMKMSWASEQNKSRAVVQNLTELSRSVELCQAEVSVLQQTESRRVEENKHLRGSFNSLLKDAIRHSDILELLLGEEVLEFLEWPIQDQEDHSIPALKERLRHHEKQLRTHNRSITLILEHRPGREEVPVSDQPSFLSDDWLSGVTDSSSVRSRTHEHQGVLRAPQFRDGSGLGNLEKAVDEVQRRVQGLEESQHNNSEAETRLHAEVMWLKRGLEEHLRVFKNIFSNTDKLAASRQTLELDKVFELVKRRQRKRESFH